MSNPYAQFVQPPPRQSQQPNPYAQFVEPDTQSAPAPKPIAPAASAGSPMMDFLARPGTPLGTLRGYISRLGEQAGGGIEQAAHGIGDVVEGGVSRGVRQGNVATGLPRMALGTVQTMASPITAAVSPLVEPVIAPLADAVHAGISKPIEDLTGYPADITDQAALQVATLGLSKAGGAILGKTLKRGEKLDIPSNEALQAQADAAYKAADDAGVVIKPEAVQRTLDRLKAELAEAGYDVDLHPGAKVGLKRLQELADSGNPVTLKGVEIVRRVARDAASPLNKSDVKFSGKVVKNIDRMLNDISPDDVLMGNAQAGIGALNTARGLWGRVSKSELIDEALQKAERQAKNSGSGGNIDNAIRQRISALLNSKSKMRGFTAEEKAAMQRIVDGRGSIHSNLRWIGKMSPQGNGLMAMLSALGGGAALAGAMSPLAMALPAAGAIAKPISNAMTKGNAAQLSSLVRSGGKRMVTRPPSGATRMLSGGQRAADRIAPLIAPGISQDAQRKRLPK